MRRGARKLLVAVCLTSAVFSAACLLVLRSGRPLYYSNGSESIIASELVDAPMLVYDTPQPVCEIPGPVQGRVQRLPDGRLIYARGEVDGPIDLVIYDPERPALEPVAASILNTAGRELSPALGPDGVLYFASDRSGGPGGFDIYSALYIEGGLFSVPRLLGETINSPGDEFDPAPAPDGNTMVFVRRQQLLGSNRNSHLLVAELNSDFAAVPLWEETRNRRVALPRLDREPAFSPDGVGLWFVREVAGSPPEILRSWRHQGEFVPPVTCPDLMVGGPFSGPHPIGNGFEIELLKHGEAPLLYRASARELFPWWAGQHSLEFFLFLCLLASLLLLMLLLLGSRWHQLDFITWCIILSLLLHLLIWMLLSGVEIIQSWSPIPSAEDRLSVRLISMDRGSQSGGDQAEQQMDRLADRLAMAERQDRIESESPDTEMIQDSSQRETPAGERGELQLESARFVLPQDVADAAEQLSPLSGRENLQQIDAEVSAVEPTQTRADGQRSLGPVEVIEVTLPAAANLPSIARAEVASPQTSRQIADLQARQDQQSVERLADAPTSADTRPLQSVERLSTAGPQSVSLSAAAATPSLSSQNQDPMQTRDRSSVAPDSVAMPASVMVAAARQSPSSRREVQVAPRPRELKVDMDSAEIPKAPAAATVAVEASLPALTSSTALRALDPGRVEDPTLRPDATDRGLDSYSALPAPRATELARATRRSSDGRRLDRLAGPRLRKAELALRDQPSSETDNPKAEAADQALAVKAQPRVAALTASAMEIRISRPALREQLRSEPASIKAPELSELPTMRRRSSETSRRADSRLDRSADKPAAPILSDRAVLASVEPDRNAVNELEPLIASTALNRLDLRGPMPQDLPRPERGGGQDDGRDLVSSGIRLPGSFLGMAPKRGRGQVASGPVKNESLYSNRFGPKKVEALARFGGTEETEKAVAAGLRYLAGIQSDSGYWGSRRRDHEKYGEVYVGKTALCLLAFLGAGHTQQSNTEHSEVVSRAIDFLLSKQDEETKHFGRKTSSYSHGISTYALAECYAITGDSRLRKPIESAVQRILDQQSNSSDTRNRGGWGYFSATLSPEDPFTRTSVSAWMIMALKSAELSGIEFPDESKRAAKSYLWRMFDRERGYFLYSKDPSRLQSGWRTLPASTPAGVFGLQLLGEDSGDSRLEAALQFTTERAPASYRRGDDDDFVLRATGNVYFWYYGSLATFMAGGDTWDRWNERLRTVLPRAQNLDGSFSAVGAYAKYAGDTREDRSYTTAMVVLCLEVYYRYFTPLLEGR